MTSEPSRRRGADPRDARSFAVEAHAVLRRATTELSWLLERGYPEQAALELVGNRHRLLERQRRAVARCADGESSVRERRARVLEPRHLVGRDVWVDGYNVLLTVETALDGGILLLGRDGVLRDLSALARHYRRVGATEPALEAIGNWLREQGVAKVRWLYDRPISNSGRLRRATELVGERLGGHWVVELVPNPDRLLRSAGEAVVASADTGILDRPGVVWVALARHVVERTFGSLDALARRDDAGQLVDLSFDPRSTS